MDKPIINIADVELQSRPLFAPTGDAAQRYEARMGFIAPRIGAQKVGYNITAVPPGKRAFPSHNHRVNEEMFFILEGTGELHVGEAIYPVRPGDVIACPSGGPERAHGIVNTGSIEMKYLAISTKLSPEIVEYPNSGKFGILAEFPDGKGDPRTFRFVGIEDGSMDYWEGE